MMFESLYLFLIRQKQLCLPGIGTLSLQTSPAVAEFVDRSFLAPQFSFVFEEKEFSTKKIFSWLAASFGITEREAVIKFNDFLFDLKREVETGNRVTWNGVGSFSRTAGGIVFHPEKKNARFQHPVVAEKVIRENAEHTMLVGEREKTSTQMTQMLSGKAPIAVEEKRSHWWLWPLVLIIISFIFLGWYFSAHGVNVSSTGNSTHLKVDEAPPGFRFVK
jgi:hypothetical protein